MARGGKRAVASTPAASRPASTLTEPRSEQVHVQEQPHVITLDLQQKLLDIFKDALHPSLEDNLMLQEIKSHLYNRDFSAAFGKHEYLRVYTSRWCPGRVLAYLRILTELQNTLISSRTDGDPRSPFRAVCLGGGAGAEQVAFAGWMTATANEPAVSPLQSIELSLVDIADWGDIVRILHETVTTPPKLSQYASQSKRNSNRALVQPEALSVNFQHLDVLDTAEKSANSTAVLFTGADLVTMMFTLNELYSTSVSKTQGLMSCITEDMRPGTHLLIVDSPGSYSTVSINGTEKKYPMQWLLDHTLLGPQPKAASNNPDAKWKKLVSNDSRWFRLPDGLQYPIDLENMRYQIHLYERLGDSGG